MRFANSLVSSIAFAVILAGCTVTPTAVKDQQYSWDGNAFNSGIIRLEADGAVITAHARDRYNGLCSIYGGKFIPKLNPDDGVTPNPSEPGTFLLTKERLTQFMTMNRWRKERV